jgi:hypothetical protein
VCAGWKRSSGRSAKALGAQEHVIRSTKSDLEERSMSDEHEDTLHDLREALRQCSPGVRAGIAEHLEGTAAVFEKSHQVDDAFVALRNLVREVAHHLDVADAEQAERDRETLGRLDQDFVDDRVQLLNVEEPPQAPPDPPKSP